MSFLWHDDPSAPCRRCGAARSCEHRSVTSPVAPIHSKGAVGKAHHKNLKAGPGRARTITPDDRPISANGNYLKVKK